MCLGLYEANCYILIDEASRETAVIDPGESSDELFKYLTDMKVVLKYILLTHGHIDHTGAVSEVKESFGGDVCINRSDEEIMRKGDFIFGSLSENDNSIIHIEDNTVLKVGNSEIKCIETPGHSPGGMCFLTENKLYSGDTLFSGSIGRTDFTGGDFNVLINSINSKLMILDGNTEVYPGHGFETSIKTEKTSNPFLISW